MSKSKRRQTDTALASILVRAPSDAANRLLTRLNILKIDAMPWPDVQASIEAAMARLCAATGLRTPEAVPDVSLADLERMLQMAERGRP